MPIWTINGFCKGYMFMVCVKCGYLVMEIVSFGHSQTRFTGHRSITSMCAKMLSNSLKSTALYMKAMSP